MHVYSAVRASRPFTSCNISTTLAYIDLATKTIALYRPLVSANWSSMAPNMISTAKLTSVQDFNDNITHNMLCIHWQFVIMILIFSCGGILEKKVITLAHWRNNWSVRISYVKRMFILESATYHVWIDCLEGLPCSTRPELSQKQNVARWQERSRVTRRSGGRCKNTCSWTCHNSWPFFTVHTSCTWLQ